MNRVGRVFVVVAALLAWRPAAAQVAPSPSGLRVHVRGGAAIHAIATLVGDSTIVRGDLIDDAGGPIPKREIGVRFGSSGARAAETCGASTSTVRADREGAIVTTDERGSFCVAVSGARSGSSLTIRFDGKPTHDAAEATVPVESQDDRSVRTIVRFEPQPEVLDLDRDLVTLTASLRVDRESAARLPADLVKREGQTLRVDDEAGHALGQAQTGGDGRARFEVPTSSLGPPGQGKLTLRFAGSAPLAKSDDEVAIVRRADVKLELVASPGKVDAEDGFALDVDARTTRGPVSDGVVEAVLGGESVGTGNVESGRAHVVIAFPVANRESVALSLRYIPSAPWWHATHDLRVLVPLARPSAIREALLAVAVLVLAAWVVYGWRRAPKPRALPGVDRATAPPSGRAGIQVLGPSVGFAGWKGTVIDAHDGAPIVGATVRIVAPAFEGDGTIATTRTDDEGRFLLEAAARTDARLIVDAETHTAYEQALPPPSLLAVALVTRRRALLDRMVKWARRQGPPYDQSPEPTPGHVRRAASRASAEPIESWARRVEHAAFGPEPVDREVEREVRGEEPRAGG